MFCKETKHKHANLIINKKFFKGKNLLEFCQIMNNKKLK